MTCCILNIEKNKYKSILSPLTIHIERLLFHYVSVWCPESELPLLSSTSDKCPVIPLHLLSVSFVWQLYDQPRVLWVSSTHHISPLAVVLSSLSCISLSLTHIHSVYFSLSQKEIHLLVLSPTWQIEGVQTYSVDILWHGYALQYVLYACFLLAKILCFHAGKHKHTQPS